MLTRPVDDVNAAFAFVKLSEEVADAKTTEPEEPLAAMRDMPPAPPVVEAIKAVLVENDTTPEAPFMTPLLVPDEREMEPLVPPETVPV